MDAQRMHFMAARNDKDKFGKLKSVSQNMNYRDTILHIKLY